MNVYYSLGFRDEGEGPCGLPQTTGWMFEYGGARRCIPAIYRFPEGIVFDLITFLEEEALHRFFEKYAAAEEPLTPMERRCVEQEHPFLPVPAEEIRINGIPMEEYSSCSILSIPWADQRDQLAPLRTAYAPVLNGTGSFACQRFRVPFPEQGNSPPIGEIKTMELSTGAVPRFFPLEISFELSEEKPQAQIRFSHPKTGTAHTLYVRKGELRELSIGMGERQCLYTVHAEYEIEPPLPLGDSLEFDRVVPQEELLTETGLFPGGEAASIGVFGDGGEAASIGIIGGADGPTAIYLGGDDRNRAEPRGPHGLPLHLCASVPSFYKEKIAGAALFVVNGLKTRHLDCGEYRFPEPDRL